MSAAPLDQHYDTLDEKIAAMSEEVNAAVERLRDDREWNRYLDTMARFHNYSLSNQLLIAIQRPDATRVGGKTLWRSLGRELKPFEERGRGITIFRPVSVLVPKKDANGNEVTGPDGKPVKERRVVKYSTATIYDVSQTTGDPLPESGDRPLAGEPPAGFEEDLDRAIAARGAKLHIGEIAGSAKGYTTKRDNGELLVVISDKLAPADRARVKAHELGHIIAGHMDNTEQYHTGDGGRRGAMEVEADSISHVLLRMNGMDPTESTGRYAAGWARVQSDDPDVVKNTAANVQKAVKKLIGEHEWQNVEIPETPKYEPKKRATRRRKR